MAAYITGYVCITATMLVRGPEARASIVLQHSVVCIAYSEITSTGALIIVGGASVFTGVFSVRTKQTTRGGQGWDSRQQYSSAANTEGRSGTPPIVS